MKVMMAMMTIVTGRVARVAGGREMPLLTTRQMRVRMRGRGMMWVK